MKIKLKTNINLWEISYNVDELSLSTHFNSGFIDDIDIVKEYFIKTNPKAINILIIKLS